MKGRHKPGDTVTVTATVQAVDEGNLKDVYEKDADGHADKEKIIGVEGDTFVHLNVMGHEISVRGSQLSDPLGTKTVTESATEG